jgi:hypothetical protein
MMKSIVIAPLTGGLVYFIAQLFISSLMICLALGMLPAAALLYMALFSENIYFELDDDGSFRYFKRGRQEQSFDLKTCRIGYRRKSESGLFGNHDIDLKISDGEDTETSIDAAPLGVSQFHAMFEDMEEFAIKDDEPIRAVNSKEE